MILIVLYYLHTMLKIPLIPLPPPSTPSPSFPPHTECSQHYQGTANIHITGGSPRHVSVNSSLTLHCTVSPVQRLRPGKPQWWRRVGGREEDLPPGVIVVQDSYDGDSCTWHSTLAIPSVGREVTGQYVCGLAGMEENVTLSIQGIGG